MSVHCNRGGPNQNDSDVQFLHLHEVTCWQSRTSQLLPGDASPDSLSLTVMVLERVLGDESERSTVTGPAEGQGKKSSRCNLQSLKSLTEAI